MKTRILSGLIMAPLLILIFLGGYFLLVGAFVISFVALREFYGAFKGDHPVSSAATQRWSGNEGNNGAAAWVGYFCLVVLYLWFVFVQIFTPLLFGTDSADTVFEGSADLLGVSAQVPMFWVFLVLILGFVSSFRMGKMNITQVLATMIGPLYIVFMAAHVYMTDSFHATAMDASPAAWYSGFDSFVWLIILGAFGTDIFAYFTGMAIGKHKLCPSISPKKTIEGSIGGIVGSMGLTLLYSHFLIPEITLADALILGALMGVVSQLGDLSASVLKRNLDVKDWGHLIPGHGGVLDRIDSVLFTAPLVYYYFEIKWSVFGNLLFAF
ncbi:MAG: phosphatidate cytidylyltransferase [Clostridiales Family XIII bacterium]|jgi:phosphatidate cytidylyltransferase|nr:phosphatidate cytidylyltransferase [Clostridiales Family XIII bacterium]